MPGFRQAQIKSNLSLRQAVVAAIRDFFVQNGFLEVQTPVRMAAPAPEPHIDAVAADGGWLQTSPELYMKRLIAAGFEKVFQICPCFRQGERGRRHLPEFTMLEWYAAGADYREMMGQTENLLYHVCRKVRGDDHLVCQGRNIDLTPPWPKLSVAEAFDRYAHMDMAAALAEDRFDEQITMSVAPRLDAGRPVILYDFPAQRTPLAKTCADNPGLAQRFELYVAGIELCNAFSELTDAAEQRRRFETELFRRTTAGRPEYPMPAAFLDALADMPEAAGNALGLDRLVMLFADTDCIDDITAFVPEED
ncbi:MAG: amino acid--tRNA ligase-related protein [Thermodesulfobacteriota bacterium]